MATHGPHLVGQGPRVNGMMSKMQLGSARLVNEEGLVSLKADCELVSYLSVYHPALFPLLWISLLGHGANYSRGLDCQAYYPAYCSAWEEDSQAGFRIPASC